MSATKRSKKISEQIEEGHVYQLEEAFTLLKKFAKDTKLTESIDVAIRLGVDVRKSDQTMHGAFLLPNGTGKQVKVAVFAAGDSAEAALKAGADCVGTDDLAEAFKKGDFSYQVVIATPDMMPMVGKLGPILGRRGLMPNPKVGTVTKDVAKAVKQVKSGQIRYRTEKGGIIHALIGNETFSVEHLAENLRTFITELKRMKPSTAKGVYLRKVMVSSTMGPGLTVNMSNFL